MQLSVEKYGLDSFSFSIIEKCDTDKLDDREKYWISKYNSTDVSKGYNVDYGGAVNRIVSERTREALRGSLEGDKSKTAKIDEDTAKLIIASLLKGKSIHGIANDFKISHKIVEGIRCKKTWKYLTKDVEFPIKRSSRYKWVSKVPNTNVPLYRAIVKINGTKFYDKCWDTAYDAAVAREIYIRENHLNATKNFPDSTELEMPTKIIYAESKFIGVCKQSNATHWVAYISIGNHQKIYVGSFKSEIDAAKAREQYIDVHIRELNNPTRNKIA